ncbi:MAG: hypothetical protein LBP59_17685 [Planctomycetaceae bacterium]|nr:hypothetical protein [Planctomycetaceae bacterium]
MSTTASRRDARDPGMQAQRLRSFGRFFITKKFVPLHPIPYSLKSGAYTART